VTGQCHKQKHLYMARGSIKRRGGTCLKLARPYAAVDDHEITGVGERSCRGRP